MGFGGGAPSPPDPMVAYRAQLKAQEDARQRLEQERGASADRFLSDNAITDDFRSNIFSQSNSARDAQIAGLDASLNSTLQDIRQRSAGRGLGTSSAGDGMLGQAQAFGDQSRQELFGSSQRRADNRIMDQQRFLDDAASSIRSGASPVSAQSRFRADITSANNAFENALSKATGGDQRNSAFQTFENDRRLAASRFKESVDQFGSQGRLASVYTGQGNPDKDKNGQVSGGFTGSLT